MSSLNLTGTKSCSKKSYGDFHPQHISWECPFLYIRPGKSKVSWSASYLLYYCRWSPPKCLAVHWWTAINTLPSPALSSPRCQFLNLTGEVWHTGHLLLLSSATEEDDTGSCWRFLCISSSITCQDTACDHFSSGLAVFLINFYEPFNY